MALSEIARLLGLARRPRGHLRRALEILALELDATASMVFVRSRETGGLRVEVSVGDHRIPPDQVSRLTRPVTDSGRPCVVPRLNGNEPPSGRERRPSVRSRPTRTLVAVPMLAEGHAVGAISVDLPFRPDRNYDQGLATLEVAAMLIAQALRITSLVEEGRRPRSPFEGTGLVPPLAEAVARYERDLLEEALRKTRGNRVQAARILRSTERIVSYKVKKYRIDCQRFR